MKKFGIATSLLFVCGSLVGATNDTELKIRAASGGWRYVVVADPGADSVLYWDDSESNYAFLTLSNVPLKDAANTFTTGQLIQPLSDYPSLTLRRYGIAQTSKILDIQTEVNGALFSVDGTGNAYAVSYAGAGTDLTGTAAGLTAGTATVANSGDTATAFFSTGTIEAARIASEIMRTADATPITDPGADAIMMWDDATSGLIAATPGTHYVAPGTTITLAENTSIALDPAGSAADKYSGITVAGTAGATLAFGDLIVLDPTDSRWELADADSAAAADGDVRGLVGICVLAAASDGDATTVLLQGIVRADTAFPTFTINGGIFISETAGDVTQTSPTTEDAVVRYLGAALTADEIYFNPSWWITYDAP